MSYPAFPTLSATATMLMLFPEDGLVNPDTMVRYDGGFTAVRETNHRAFWKNTVRLQIESGDRITVVNFIRNTAHCRVYPFTFTHPDPVIGELVVRYMSDTLPMPRAIQGLDVGNHISGLDRSMYEIDLPLEEQY